ncbi:hypothetical protein BC739_006175 [Kutzneria viridogrisea]|uniref:Uncharacterized protein n=1 Tax=Kutzneria viridogrisea TaxID=47990 RepID=A0ABR6BQQ9_9PSEU|nr:hypothetical protein [Kutzneria viridogrisea]
MPTTGGEVHALVARPADAPEGPLPTVFAIHGGPHAADEDRFSAYRAVWLGRRFRRGARELPRLHRLRLGCGATPSRAGPG